MGIRERIEDAPFLWQNGRFEGAMLSALVAFASIARLRYSDHKTIGDRKAFEKFFTDSFRGIWSIEYRGGCYLIEHIFYKWLRCELVHEGDIPIDIEFMSDNEPSMLSIRAGGAPEYTLKLSHGWFNHIIGAVISAPENKGLFDEYRNLSNE